MISRFGSMAAVAGMVAFVAACGTTYPDYPAFPGSPGHVAPQYAPAADLTGTSWVLESGTPVPAAAPAQPAPAEGAVQTAPAATPAPASTPWLLPGRGSRPTLRFSADRSQVTGATGCNTYFGNVHVGGNSLTFGPLATTKMMCFDSLAVQEIQYLGLLSRVTTYANDGAQLTLNTGDGRQLVFSPLNTRAGATAATYNYVCDDGLYFSAAYDPAAGTAAIRISTGATDTLVREAGGTAYSSQRHVLRARGSEATLTTLYDGVTHRCNAPLAPQG